MQIEWWHWAVAGVALILAELAVPAFVLVWFGLGGLLVALVVALSGDLSLNVQLGIWLIASLAFTVLWFKVFKPGQLKTRVGGSDSNVVGEIGLLTRDVAPFEKGEVRFQKPILGGEVWACLADEAIAAGTRVKLVAVEGSFVKVAKL
ncbi:MAG: NfeD family protein [Rhodocyclaceae bacterium]|nr:MAG: NfeD family protein [Rhodocyclaceae bacterium]